MRGAARRKIMKVQDGSGESVKRTVLVVEVYDAGQGRWRMADIARTAADADTSRDRIIGEPCYAAHPGWVRIRATAVAS